MKLYPIKKEFYYTFKNKEEILQHLLFKNSRQLEMICEEIDVDDFIYRLQRFYDIDNYEIKNNFIRYTHPVSKEVSYCMISNNHFNLSNLKGFELFIQRYYSHYYFIDDNYKVNKWYSFYNNHEFIY